MKQILQNIRTGETLLTEVPSPPVSAGHLLVATQASLISLGTERMLVEFGKAGYLSKARQQPEKVRQVLSKVATDGLFPTLESIRSKLETPLELGYCNAGVVVEVGRDVLGFNVGDRVASNGGHAEIVRVPTNLCAKVPDEVEFESACYTVAASIALQGVRLAEPTLGERFVVIGLGLIGQLAVQILKANGCQVMAIDLEPTKCELASPFCDETLHSTTDLAGVLSATSGFTQGSGVDGVLVTASTKSNDPMNFAAAMCRKRGRIVQVGATGLQLDRDPLFKKELRLQVSCSYGPGRYDPLYENQGLDYPSAYVRWTEQRNFQAVLELLRSGVLRVNHLTTHRFSINDAAKAYAEVTTSRSALGIVLQYPSTDLPLTDKRSRRTISVHSTEPVTHRETNRSSARISVIGAGVFSSRSLLPQLKRAGATLQSIASSGGVSAAHCAKKFGFQSATTDSEGLLRDPNTDAVVIATRHNTHARFAIDALQNRKAVFVEKPLCLLPEELEKIAIAHEAAVNPILMVGFNRRFAPLTRKMKELLDGIREPKTFIVTVNAGVLPDDHWHHERESGGGRVLAEGCHFIDLLRYLVGSTISRIEAVQVGENRYLQHCDDKVSITLRFGDGSIGTIHYFGNGPMSFPKERIEVFTNGKALQLDNFKSLRGFGWPKFRKATLWKQDKGHAGAIEAFVDAVRLQQPSPIRFDELVEVTQTCFEINQIAS